MSTLVLVSNTGGTIYSTSPTYSLARSGTGLSASTDGIYVGQTLGYTIYEGFIDFDTSPLGSDASISAAVLEMYLVYDGSTTDFTVNAAVSAWGATLETADWVAGADLAALTTVATLASSGIGAAGSRKTFVDVALAGNINKTANTRLLLYSSRHSGNNTPGGDEYLHLGRLGVGYSYQYPKLTITYTVGAAAGQTHQGML